MSQHSFLGPEWTAATSAPVPHSVHWMGCTSSFDARWGSSQSFFLVAHHCTVFFLFLFFFFLGVLGRFFFVPDFAHIYPTHLHTLMSIALTLVPYWLPLYSHSYLPNLATILTNYPTNLTTLLINYLTNFTSLLTCHCMNYLPY
jgi:hypothetical protein